MNYFEDTPNYMSFDGARSYCYPFNNIQNLTEFEAKVADHLCDIGWANQDLRYNLQEYHRELQGITIASLVLNAVTVLFILIYVLYSLYSYYRRRKQDSQSVAI